MAKEKDYFWQIQGLTSFCKARGDWLEFDRVHLSFVKHEGKANNCKQILAIEGAIKLHGSDGALFLSELVLSGAAKKMAIKAKEEASNGYPQPIFSSMGGTVSSRSQKGQCMFRQFSVAPGTKSDFVLQMMTCPGEENATGGIQPIKGAKRDTVYVPLSSGDLADFARSIQMEVTAFRTAKMLSGTSVEKNEGGNVCETPLTSSPTPAKDPMLVIIYETTGIVNNGMPFVAHVDNSINELKTVIQMLLAATERYVCVPEQYNHAVELIGAGEKGSAIISLAGKQNPNKKASIVVVTDMLR